MISFSFMSRQLVWDHFSSLALVALPLVDWDALRYVYTWVVSRDVGRQVR